MSLSSHFQSRKRTEREPPQLSKYEAKRARNIAENQAALQALGLAEPVLMPAKPSKSTKAKASRPAPPKRNKLDPLSVWARGGSGTTAAAKPCAEPGCRRIDDHFMVECDVGARLPIAPHLPAPDSPVLPIPPLCLARRLSPPRPPPCSTPSPLTASPRPPVQPARCAAVWTTRSTTRSCSARGRAAAWATTCAASTRPSPASPASSGYAPAARPRPPCPPRGFAPHRAAAAAGPRPRAGQCRPCGRSAPPSAPPAPPPASPPDRRVARPAAAAAAAAAEAEAAAEEGAPREAATRGGGSCCGAPSARAPSAASRVSSPSPPSPSGSSAARRSSRREISRDASEMHPRWRGGREAAEKQPRGG